MTVAGLTCRRLAMSGAESPSAISSSTSRSRGDSTGRSSIARIWIWRTSSPWTSGLSRVSPRATAATVSQISSRLASFDR